jgi:HAD superfamily hydrolase (TIGR01509 family)
MKWTALTGAILRNMGSKRAVLWDMDGVLVDSGELHYQSWLETLTALSIPFNRDKFRSTFGMNNRGILTILLGKPPEADFLEMVSDRKESLFRELIHGRLQLLPGALGWLRRLQQRGTLQAVASSAPQANIQATVDELNIRQYFSALISAYSLPGKPDPAVFLEAARQLGVQPEQCVVVEDAVAGVAAAKKAGMKCIAICTTHPTSALSAADIIANNLEGLVVEDFD